MTPEHAAELAPFLPEYRFGSEDLKELHAKNRGCDGRYNNLHPVHYVVFHEGLRGMPSFKTLNTLVYGQLVPKTADLPHHS